MVRGETFNRAAPAPSGAAPRLSGAAPTEAALRVVRVLEASGLQAWLVGGWVRDSLMGVPCHDIDITCSGSWQASARALRDAGIHVVESGIRFGGITAVADGERIEVTSFRVDGFYTDGRHPESVEPARTVEEDLARRDFTVNAMAWHPERGLCDPFDGRGDIRRGVIRAVGEPRRRFEEDALRMLRAVRFACRLGFDIEPATSRALASCAHLMGAVASERIGIELSGILLTGRAGAAMLDHREVFCAAVPELERCVGFDQRSRYHAFDVYGHTARVVEAACAPELHRLRPLTPALAWAALLHDAGKPGCFTLDDRGQGHFYGHPEAGERIARGVLRRLAVPGDVAREACLLIRYHDRPMEASRSGVLQMMSLLSGQGIDAPRLMDDLLDLRRGDTLGKDPSCFPYVEEIERMREIARESVANGDAYSLATLDLAGSDLLARGVEPGPRVGELLRRALAAEIAGEVPNEREALLRCLGLADRPQP